MASEPSLGVESLLDEGLQGGALQAGALSGEGLVGSLGEEGCREAGVGVRGAHTGEGVWTRPHRGLSECGARSWGVTAGWGQQGTRSMWFYQSHSILTGRSLVGALFTPPKRASLRCSQGWGLPQFPPVHSGGYGGHLPPPRVGHVA